MQTIVARWAGASLLDAAEQKPCGGCVDGGRIAVDKGRPESHTFVLNLHVPFPFFPSSGLGLRVYPSELHE